MIQNFSHDVCKWLIAEKYTHCFFLAGGNIMHLMNQAKKSFTCVPFVSESSAVIASEYFNEFSEDQKSFVLVTAGPGITNCITGITGSWLESRPTLVIAGQVKSSDLKNKNLRLRGIQEVDGISITKEITKASLRITKPISEARFKEIVSKATEDRPGPVFIEICLDAQNSTLKSHPVQSDYQNKKAKISNSSWHQNLIKLINNSERPIILLGGRLSRSTVRENLQMLENCGVPVMTTWNAIDRVPDNFVNYWGRPQSQGQRAANVLIQQADLLIAVGTRLGIQQTGFNFNEFIPLGKIVQVFDDEYELAKNHFKVEIPICENPDLLLRDIIQLFPKDTKEKIGAWKTFGDQVLDLLSKKEFKDTNSKDYLSPSELIVELSKKLNGNDLIVCSSSGGTFTTFMQSFVVKAGQKIASSGALASMGYALPGAIGASFSDRKRRVIVIDGDGGFAQSISELGTLVQNLLPIKIFLFDNKGYGSIRNTQTNLFSDNGIGTDRETGLGLPNWRGLFESFGIEVFDINSVRTIDEEISLSLNSHLPVAYIVRLDPEQKFFPRVGSRMDANGILSSDPLHLMTPQLPLDVAKRVFKYLERD
jgi:acetolactate synthase-1/2/3 large subunit